MTHPWGRLVACMHMTDSYRTAWGRFQPAADATCWLLTPVWVSFPSPRKHLDSNLCKIFCISRLWRQVSWAQVSCCCCCTRWSDISASPFETVLLPTRLPVHARRRESLHYTLLHFAVPTQKNRIAVPWTRRRHLPQGSPPVSTFSGTLGKAARAAGEAARHR